MRWKVGDEKQSVSSKTDLCMVPEGSGCGCCDWRDKLKEGPTLKES